VPGKGNAKGEASGGKGGLDDSAKFFHKGNRIGTKGKCFISKNGRQLQAAISLLRPFYQGGVGEKTRVEATGGGIHNGQARTIS